MLSINTGADMNQNPPLPTKQGKKESPEALWLHLFKTECQLTTPRRLDQPIAKIHNTAPLSSPTRSKFHSTNAVKCPYQLDIQKIEALPLPSIVTDAKLATLKDLKVQLRVSWFDLETGVFYGKTWVCPGEVSLLDHKGGVVAGETPVADGRVGSRTSSKQSAPIKNSAASVKTPAKKVKKMVKKTKVVKPKKIAKKKKKKTKDSILSDSLDSSVTTSSDDYSESDSSSDDSEDGSEEESESEYTEEEEIPMRSASPTRSGASPSRSVAAPPTKSSAMTKYIVGHSLSIKLKEQQVSFGSRLIIIVRTYAHHECKPVPYHRD
jgi:hypothetical protein